MMALAGILFILATYFLLFHKEQSFSKSFDVDENIDKIFLVDMMGNQILLSKEDNKLWLLDGKHKIRKDAIKNLLETIKKVKIKAPVPMKQQERIQKGIAAEGIKVEIYEEGKQIQQYYVGGSTQDHKGTYMYHEGLGKAYITHIPGFIGYLTPRYFTDYDQWRDRTVIEAEKKKIKKISIKYREDTNLSSFELNLKPLSLFINQKEIDLENINTEAIESYLNFFKHLELEGYENQYKKKDSVLSTPPFCILEIANEGNIDKFDCYNLPLSNRSKLQYDQKGNAMKYDIDRLLVNINNGRDFGMIQMFVFGEILREPEDFLR
jgi:hypothetical protein